MSSKQCHRCALLLCAMFAIAKLPAQISRTGVPPPVTPAVPAATAATVPTRPPGITVGSASDARLINLSTRAHVAAGTALITGFAIRGAEPRAVLVRAVGPGLRAFGIDGVLTAPRLRLHAENGDVLAENAGWSGSATLANAIASAGAFPLATRSADAAVLVTLAPGTYSVEVLDASDNAGGVVLAEIYDVQGTADGSRLVNVSTRTTVAPDGGELISGFILAGTAPREFLVRGIGPALASFDISGALVDPTITIHDREGRVVAANDNWSGSTVVVSTAGAPQGVSGTTAPQNTSAVQVSATAAAAAAATILAMPVVAPFLEAAARRTGAFPLALGSRDAAVIVTLAPGAYTVQVSGATPSESGVALLEIYELL